MNKTSYVIIISALILSIGIIFLGGSKNNIKINEPAQNVEMRNGTQYIVINARGGYSPRVSTAKAGIPTKLIVKTNGTYDCSAALMIRSLSYQKILPQTGEETIDLGIPKIGALQGICGMGMYNFVINFE